MDESLEPRADCRRLPIDFPDDDTMRISHEAIIKRSLFRAVERWVAS